jgi:hypothetical protein
MATKNVIEGSNKVSASQIKDLFRQIEEGGITGDHIQAILERRNPFDKNLELKQVTSNEQLYKVEIDGNKTSEQLIKEGGYGSEWNWKELNDIPILNKTKRIIDIKLFSFNDNISIGKIIEEIVSQEFYPTTFDELLNLGIQHPKMQIQFNIVALGTVHHCDTNYSASKQVDWADNIPTLMQGNKVIRLIKREKLNHRKFDFIGIELKFAGSKIIK